MATHKVSFLPSETTVEVSTGTLISEAIRQAGLEINQPCGGQGRCGRCAVILAEGKGARRRSTIRLSSADIEAGHALACQTVIEGDVTITIPEPERIERRLVTDKTARKVELPFSYDPSELQSVRAAQIHLPPPTIQDNRDDLSRLEKALEALGYAPLEISLSNLRQLGAVLRNSQWSPWALLEFNPPDFNRTRLVDLSAEAIQPVGLAIDIGTTTVSAYLIDLTSGQVLNMAAEYNDQIARGEDVISRIIYAEKGGLAELSQLVRGTISTLLERIRIRTGVSLQSIHKVTVAGNTTMIHLFLELPPSAIRLEPYIPTVNFAASYLACELDLPVHPQAPVLCLPGVASYVGADITAGVLSCGLAEAEQLTLFIDVGTNGEIVLGNRDWMVTCACSAGPAFEGAGVVNGMRATEGAIEEAWIHSETFEPTLRVIGGQKASGICGSGLISLLAELFVTGVIDRGGNFNQDLDTPRVRQGPHGPEYVVIWGEESEKGKDIAITKVDIDNLMRAKAAIYAGFSVLAASVGVDLSDVQQVLVGGAFGKYINVENAIKIGLLPDLAWDRFQFLGNTSILGSYMALLSWRAVEQIKEIAGRMTYIELSADNTFYEAFTAALFLPHTEISRFPSVAEIWDRLAKK